MTRCLKTALAGLSLLLASCGQQLPAWNAGRLVVIVPEAAHGAEAEFERELAQLFARRLNAALETIPMPQDKISSALRKHKAHFAAASLRSDANIDRISFCPRSNKINPPPFTHK